MKFSKKQIIRFIVMLVFFSCMIFANFYSIRMAGRYMVEVYLYDKLLVAYNVAGNYGLREELKKILAEDKFPHELAKAREFEIKLKSLKDPAAFLSGIVEQKKQKIMLFKALRTAAIMLMFLIFTLQLVINFSLRFRSKV